MTQSKRLASEFRFKNQNLCVCVLASCCTRTQRDKDGKDVSSRLKEAAAAAEMLLWRASWGLFERLALLYTLVSSNVSSA